MDIRFEIHNQHLEDPSEFVGRDPHLRHLAKVPKKARKLCFSDPFIYHAVRS